ncbi:hypothetical protein KR038_001181, partial [Drosophila bunnanda]
MSTKRVSFELMSLGYPVHTGSFDIEHIPTQDSARTETELNVLLPDKLLRDKLIEEAKNLHIDFVVRDPSSSDESDDYAFPETISEQVRRLSFAKRRRLHYTEFSTVELARRLVCQEFASETSSLKSDDSSFRSPRLEEECPPCWTLSNESHPFLRYDGPTADSQTSDESILKEDLEPGFDPSHPCYRKLANQPSWPTTPKQDATPAVTEMSTAVQSIAGFHQPKDGTQSKMTSADAKAIQESLERHTRVLDKGEKWDLQ